MTDKPKVVGIRLTADQLQRYVHGAAKEPWRVVFKDPPDRRNLAGELTYRQILKCLAEGQVVGTPTFDKDQWWRFRMRRHAAGLTVTVHAAAQAEGARVHQIFVLDFDAE